MNSTNKYEKSLLVDILPQFLVLEPDVMHGYWIKNQLQSLGAAIHLFPHSKMPKESLFDNYWHLIILDAHWSDRNGLEMCRHLRQQFVSVPIIFTASENEMMDGLLSLEFGADEYLSKPIKPMELIARTKALLRRRNNTNCMNVDGAEAVTYKGFSLNRDNRELILNGVVVRLTAREFDLIWLLANHPNKVFSRSELLNKVWGYNYSGYEQTVNSHVNRLRNKLKVGRPHSNLLETVWGIGYRFRVV